MPEETPAQRVVDDLNDLLGVEARQMITAREAADTALASGDVDALAVALDRMGVPAEDNPALLAGALMALPAQIQGRQLDQIEFMNTLPADQPAVLKEQRSRPPAAGPTPAPAPAAPAPGHPARAAAAAVDRPTDAVVQRTRPSIGDRAAEVVAPSPDQPSASPDRGPSRR